MNRISVVLSVVDAADATLLPNGDVVVLNGGQSGVAGYPVTFKDLPAKPSISQSNYPAFWAFLYQPDAPQGQVGRWCRLWLR
jgi:hypothetical protein